MKFTKKQLQALKREVKAKTGMKMKDIDIYAVCDEYIVYSFYATNYDRVVGKKTYEKIERK